MAAYDDLVDVVFENSGRSFTDATSRLSAYINGISRAEVSEMLIDIGAIPQSIKPSSSEEKLYSKVTDIILSRCFEELGLDSEVLESRGNSADVQARSRYHGYSLVADSKAMRLSRTAKNQKDFKVGALGDNWVGDNDTFAVLCCPLYQYPSKKSQIYEQALNNKTCFMSWEHLKYLIDNDVREDDAFSLEPIWSYAVRLSRSITVDRNANFFDRVNDIICTRISRDEADFHAAVHAYARQIAGRALQEKNQILEERIQDIRNLSREDAINLLVEQERKKTDQMDKLINKLNGGEEE
jgi:type II restriction enzyme